MLQNKTMPSIVKYPDAVRQQVIALYQGGKGYKAISSALGLPRDTVRNWIMSYRLTGRTEAVQTTGKLRNAPSFQNREELYAAAREEYENSSDSLLSIARKHGLEYRNLRNFLQQYHPESALLHTYIKQAAVFQETLDRQRTQLDQMEKEFLGQLKESLDKEILRFAQHDKEVAQKER